MYESITNGLNELKLYGMAKGWDVVLDTLRKQTLSLEQGISLLIQSEKDYRLNRKTANLLKRAKFRYQATIGEVFFDSAKGKDQDRIMVLATCEYVERGESVLVTGPSGVGKSFLASALGQQACLNGYKVRYYSMGKLMDDIQLARIEGKIVRFFEQMSDYDLIIIEDFGMVVLTKQQLLDLMALVEDRHCRRSMIITSQLPLENWYEVLSANKTIADAIMDRLKCSQLFKLTGHSLRGTNKKNIS